MPDSSGYSLVTRGETYDNMVFLESVLSDARREPMNIAYFVDRGIHKE
ncbi:MAG: hypothetical protein QW816_04075 [Desulfurococcaceae archaeon]